MNAFTLTIATDNDAFGETEEDALAEIARILRDVAARVENTQITGLIRDTNGNHVGRFDWTL